jgi:hypothetical protein
LAPCGVSSFYSKTPDYRVLFVRYDYFNPIVTVWADCLVGAWVGNLDTVSEPAFGIWADDFTHICQYIGNWDSQLFALRETLGYLKRGIKHSILYPYFIPI